MPLCHIVRSIAMMSGVVASGIHGRVWICPNLHQDPGLAGVRRSDGHADGAARSWRGCSSRAALMQSNGMLSPGPDLSPGRKRRA